VAGFSIIELALALGIISFAFVGLLGLLPAGMNTFRQSIDTAVSFQISQRIIGEALDSDFNTFISKAPEIRYFDYDANELPDEKGAIYSVHVRVQPAVTVPGAASVNSHLAGITVQIARNPSGKTLTVDANDLWQADCTVPMTWYSTFLAGACNQTPHR
jgi:uncharacterized protein (TIGR02598 family)